jgi:hypothetical protein
MHFQIFGGEGGGGDVDEGLVGNYFEESIKKK